MASHNLRDRVPDSVPDDVELFEKDGEVKGRDEHGEFALDPMTGSSEPQNGRCGWPVRWTQERYGETRYCTQMPESTFIENGSDRCRTHKSADALMERAQELFEHGYFATNYVNFAKRLSTPKFLFAVEMVGGLFEMSQHDFDTETETRAIDASDTDLIEEETVEVELPIPTNELVSVQANELWTAALKEVMTQNMQEAVFRVGMSEQTLAASSDMEGQITDTYKEPSEHHLHLPLSRVATDIKNHLQNGGVTIDDDETGAVTFQQNDYTLDVSPTESDQSETESVSEVSENFAERLKAEDDQAEIEVE